MSSVVWAVVGKNEDYEHYRTRASFGKLRSWADAAYASAQAKNLLDKDFLDRLRNDHFFARLWELKMAEWLQLTGLELIPTNGNGPDFCIKLADSKIWIEAVLPTPDVELDHLWRKNITPPGQTPMMYDTPKDERTLRFSTSLVRKAESIKAKHLSKFGPKDCVLIAISAFPPGALHSDMSYFMAAIMPIGDLVVHISPNGALLDPAVRRTSHATRASIKNKNGKDIPMEFLYPGDYFPFIDGVLFSESSDLQELLGVWSLAFDEATKGMHLIPNFSSKKTIPAELTDKLYLHRFIVDPPHVSLEQEDPKFSTNS